MNRDKIRARLRAHFRPEATERGQWWKIRNAAGTGGQPAEVFIYDEIGWVGHTAQDFMTELKGITAPEITLRLNSPGGEIFDGIAIYSQLRNHPARVTVHVDSLAASIASVIAQAGDRIVMQPFSQMMIHDGSGMCIGDAGDMLDMAQLLDRQSDNIAAIYNERAGGGQKSWRQKMKAETWYTAEEAVAAGLADEVGKPARQAEPADERMAAQWDLSVFRHAGRADAPAPEVPVNAATIGEAVAQAEPLPDALGEGYTGAADESAPGTPPQDDLTTCPECGANVPAEELASHQADQHEPADIFTMLAQLTPPTGGLVRAALEHGAQAPIDYDPEELRATLRTLVAEAPANAAPEPEELEISNGPTVCPECGATLPDDEGVVECPECGARVTTDSPNEEGTPADVMRETLATLAAEAPAPELVEQAEPEPEPDRSGWLAEPEPEPEPTVAELAAQAIEAVAAEAPAPVLPAEPEPAPLPPAAWREPEPLPPQTAPPTAWHDLGDVIAAAIRIQADHMGAPAEQPEPAPPIETPHPDPVLMARAIREEALR